MPLLLKYMEVLGGELRARVATKDYGTEVKNNICS
jgi:hypothetical protein